MFYLQRECKLGNSEWEAKARESLLEKARAAKNVHPDFLRHIQDPANVKISQSFSCFFRLSSARRSPIA